MTPITEDFATVLLRDLEGLQREIALYPDDHTLWVTPQGITNSGGNLALHIAGNIQHFIGHEMGGLSYRRDRDAEFGRRGGSRTELIEQGWQGAPGGEGGGAPRGGEGRAAAPHGETPRRPLRRTRRRRRVAPPLPVTPLYPRRVSCWP